MEMSGKLRSPRALRAILAGLSAVVVVLGMSVAISAPAQADPVRGAGCKSWDGTQKYKVGGVTFYGIEMHLNFCWTTGGANSRIKKITGSNYPWANMNNQVQHGVGPANGSKIKIAKSWKSSSNTAKVNYFFQSRSCLTGPLNMGCSAWTWHRIKLRLHYGGHVEVLSRS